METCSGNNCLVDISVISYHVVEQWFEGLNFRPSNHWWLTHPESAFRVFPLGKSQNLFDIQYVALSFFSTFWHEILHWTTPSHTKLQQDGNFCEFRLFFCPRKRNIVYHYFHSVTHCHLRWATKKIKKEKHCRMEQQHFKTSLTC